MISIKADTYSDPLFGGPLSDYVLYLYCEFSVDPLPSTIKIPNDNWKTFIHMLYSKNEQEDPIYEYCDDFKCSLDNYDINKVILALSGGKDSTASLLRLIDEGKDVTAYYCKKANLSYPKEEDTAGYIANMYNIPLVKDELLRSGKTDFFENPVKNMVFIARMIEWAVKNNCAVIQLGEYYDTDNTKVHVKYSMSDSIDFMLAFEEAVKSNYPDIKLDFMFQYEATGMYYIISRHPEVLPHIRSCLMPQRYFNRQRRMVIDRYNLSYNLDNSNTIMEGRCMSCWKCVTEYVFLVLTKKVPLNKDYLQNKVLPTLIKKMPEIATEWAQTDEFKNADTKLILEYAVALSDLSKYINDDDYFMSHIHHRYPELDRK